MNGAVTEGIRLQPESQSHERGLVRNGTERKQRPAAAFGERRNLLRKIPVALPDLACLRLVLGRQAFDGISDPAAGKLQIVCGRSGAFMIRKPEFVQRPVQKNAGKIAGKRPSRTVRAMHPGSKTNNEELGSVIAKRKYGTSVIIRVARFHLIQKSGQARTSPAINRKPGFHSVSSGIL